MIRDESKFELRHVLYCDLLGFSNYAKSEFFEAGRCFRLFKQLDEWIIDASTHMAENDLDKASGRKYDYIVNPELIYCSDSLIVSTPATNIDAMWLFEAAARIQNGMCAHGFLLRGSIVTGNLYHSGNTIFGPAIVDAVAKDKSGGAPVILIDELSLKYFCLASTDEDEQIINIRKHQLVAEDDCDASYIDPFWMSKIAVDQEIIHPKIRINLDYWRTLIEGGLKNKCTNILEKYTWMANRFNKVICNKASGIKSIPLP